MFAVRLCSPRSLRASERLFSVRRLSVRARLRLRVPVWKVTQGTPAVPVRSCQQGCGLGLDVSVSGGERLGLVSVSSFYVSCPSLPASAVRFESVEGAVVGGCSFNRVSVCREFRSCALSSLFAVRVIRFGLKFCKRCLYNSDNISHSHIFS